MTTEETHATTDEIHISTDNYRNKKKTMIMMVVVLNKTTAPQLNIILQPIERCELAIGVGQRARDFSIEVQIPMQKLD
jgi:hypothetical protein